MDFGPKRNMSTFQPPPRPMLFNISAEKPRELSMDYVAALPSQRYLYRGDNCQLMMSRQFCTDSSATPVFQSAATRPHPMPKVATSHRSVGGFSSLTSFVGNALTGMMTSLFGQKKMVIPPPFEYQLNEQHIRGVDLANYDKQKQKILTLFDPKLTPVSTPEPGLIFDTDTSDPFQRYMDAAQQVAPTKVTIVEPPVEAISESVPEHKKRAKVLEVTPMADKMPTKSCVEPLLKPLHSPSSFRHSHHKVMNKNRKEKARHEIELNIREDLSDQDDAVDDEPLSQAVTSSEEHAEKTETTKQTVPLLTSVSDFPVISCPISASLQQRTPPQTNQIINNNNNDHTSITSLPRSCSECESDDNFIVFASDAASTTPESSYNGGSPKKSLSRCKSITDALRLKRFGGAFRQRQASECSEDSFVVFADDSEAPTTKEVEWSDEDDCDDSDSDDSSEVSETESESEYGTEDEQVDADVESKINFPQLDSGFEEKKVRFNLVPKVVVIRAWDFAYRKARIGKWEEAARDRERFKTRICQVGKTLAPIFADQHRQQVYSQRFSNVVDGGDKRTPVAPA